MIIRSIYRLALHGFIAGEPFEVLDCLGSRLVRAGLAQRIDEEPKQKQKPKAKKP